MGIKSTKEKTQNVRLHKLRHQFYLNLKHTFFYKQNLFLLLMATVMMVAGYVIDFRWDVKEAKIIASLDGIFFLFNTFFFGMLFNKRTAGTYLLFTTTFRFFYLAMILVTHDIELLISGDLKMIKNIKDIMNLVDTLIIAGFVMANIAIFPLLLILLLISTFDVYVATKLKARWSRMTWFIWMVLIQLFVAIFITENSKVIENFLLENMYQKLLIQITNNDPHSWINGLSDSIYNVASQIFCFIWLPLLIRFNKFRRTNVFPNMDSILSVALLTSMINTLTITVLMKINWSHNIIAIPIFIYIILWLFVLWNLAIFIRTFILNWRESKKESYMPYVFSEKVQRNKIHKVILDFWKHDDNWNSKKDKQEEMINKIK